MITPSQIRAARALLSWDAAELSKRSGIARATIFNIENGVTHGRDESLSKIRKAFEAENLEFIDGQGVRFRPEGVDVLSGREGLVAFLDDVYSYLSANGGVVCTTNIDEQRWSKAYGEENAQKHFTRMQALIKRRNDVKFKSLTSVGHNTEHTSSYTEYRWAESQQSSAVPFYLYGDRLGIIVFEADPTPKILFIRSRQIADAYAVQFDSIWKNAGIIPSIDK